MKILIRFSRYYSMMEAFYLGKKYNLQQQVNFYELEPPFIPKGKLTVT